VKYSVILILLASFSLRIYPQAEPPVVSQSGTQTTRSIEGTVLDVKGSPVPGAIILLKDTKTLQVRSYIAQKDGKYHFFGLSSDINYELRAQANGMTSPEKMVSVFDSRKVVKLNLKLKKKLKSSS
jgi:Carboxypeptidase regulatory-like domain